MANKFNLTAELNLRGPTNIRTVVADIRRQLGTINADVRINVNPAATRNINSITQRLTAMNSVLVTARNNTDSLNASLRNLTGTIQSVNSVNTRTVTTTSQTATSMASAAKSAQMATSAMQEFGKQSALAIKRFAAFSFVTTGIYALINAVNQGVTAFINYDKQLVRLQQITGQTRSQLSSLDKTITQLATSFGISSESLIGIADTLAQAGLTAEETRVALTALAKTELAPSFDDISRTTEGAIAALRQFSLEAGDLEAALGSINAVSARFAVESGDIIAAIQRTGGVFAAASKGVSQGKDALNEFIAVFTSVRATTRESAETIATGLRTIFTRIQRAGTIKQLRDFGVELQDLEGKFVGPFEAVRRLSEALNQLDPRDVRFSTIVEELGGFRQIGKVIPLIQQFATAQEALKVAQTGQASLSGAQVKSQQALQIQIAKVREEFLALVRDIGQSSSFQALAKIILGLASTFIKLVSAFKPVLPILAVIGAIKGASAITKFAGGFFGAFKKGGGAGSAGTSIGERLTGTAERERTEVTARASELTRENTNALVSLTSAIERLESVIRSRGPTTLASGGKVLGFNSGGVVPGSGKGDKVPAMLEPGEVVINNKAATKYGRSNLNKINKYAEGGRAGYSLYVDYADPETINPDFLDQGLANIVNEGIKQFTPKQGKGKPATANSIKNFRLYRSIKGSVLEESLRRAGAGQESARGSFDYNQWPGNIPAFDSIPAGIPTDARLSAQRGEDIESFKEKIGSYLNTASGSDKNRKRFGSAVFEPGVDKVIPFQFGGKIQKFKEGSRGGIDWKSLSKGRGKAGSRGARDIVEPISTETYLKWAKGIYDEYDADPSLVMAVGPGGLRQPPEIALANKLLSEYAFETGGAGLSVGKRFVRTPKERISDELRPFLIPDPSDPNEFGFFEDDVRKFGRAKVLSKAATAKLGRQSALEAAAARNAGYANAESAISSFKATGTLDVDPSIMGYLIESIRNPDNLPLEPKELDKLKKKLTKPNLDAFDALVGPDKIPVGVQGQRTKLSEVFGKILETYGSDTSDLEIDNIIRGVGSRIQDKRLGGIIQKFMAGSVGGVMEQTEEALPSDLAGLIKEIAKIGGTTQLYDFVPKSEIEGIIKEKKVFPRPTAKQLVSSSWLTAQTPDLYGDRGKYIEPLKEVVKRARSRFSTKQSGIQAQLLRNVQAASGQGYKFGLASIYGPQGQLGYSSTSDAKKIKGPDGTEYLTQIIRKSLPENFLGAVRATSEDIAGVPARAAERFQYAKIFDPGGPLAFDFDETLVKGSDIPGKNPADYSDLNKVQEALKNAELTLLGKELQRRIKQYPELLDGIRVLTARPQSNAPYLASTLSRLGLPIPEGKITGVSGGLNKVDNLSELETLIDDNLENIQSVMGGGKKGILYSEPRQPDTSSRSIQVMEGYALEEMVKSLGVNISSDNANPLRPIDYPDGLGVYASDWNLPPNIPTDTKRTNSSSAVNRLFEEAERFYAANFAIGGMVKLGKGGYSRSPSKLVPNDPSFDPGPMEAGSQGVDYRSILENSGLDLQNWLVNKLAFEAKTNQFSENEILEHARKTKEQMGSRPKTNVQNLLETLRQPARFAIGGLADATGSMQSLMSGLYGNRGNVEQSNKPKKNFGRIALRDSGSRIQATYMKEGQAGQDRSGQVIADKVNSSLYAVQSSAATKGYGPKLYDIVMEAATAAGGMLTSDRRTVSDAAKGVWAYYFKNRSDVKKTPLDPENWVSNSRLLDEKLYGPPETWPPSTDPAWILQSGYSKSPNLINTPDVVRVDPIKNAIANNEPYLPDMLNRGGFASGGTVPAMVSNGEAFVPPKLAKKIGYAKLDKMNQADRNGMRKYSGGGGIGVFKGPGSGTSDSIGPIGLPQGSYVIREKATKALGLKRGGGVGIQNFVAGGSPSGFSMPPMPIGLEDIRGIKEEILNNYKKLYADEKKRIDELYDSLEAQARADFMSGALSLDELQDNLETLLEARILAKRQTKETLTAQTQTAQTQASAQYRSDPFYMAKKAADEYAESVGKAAETSKQMAEEQKAYIEYIAREKGLSSKGLQRQLTKDVARESYQVKARSRFGQEELKAIAAGSSRTLRGKDVTSLLQTDTQEGRQIQDIVNAFEAKLKEINPSMENAREEAEKLAVGLSQGDQSVQQYIASNDTLNTLLNTQISDTDAYNEAVRRAAAAAGISEEALRSLANEAEVVRREFAETPEGKRYGVLAEIAPDITKQFSQSGLGKGLGKIEDFFSGKGGTLSKLAGRAGGLTGLATAATAAIPFAAESLFTKEQMKDPNVAGGISAVTGATSMAAAGFELAGGGIPGIIAAGAGLLLGGIKGWFEGKNQAVFTNAIENLAKTTNTLEIALKELEKEATPKSIEKFNKAAGDAFMAQQDIANIAFSEQRSALGSATSGEALTGAALGAAIGTAIAPGIGTAIGAGIGYLAGAFTDYYSKFDPQQIAEAGGAYANAAVSQYEAQTRAAEIKTEQLPIAEIDAMMKALNDGVKGAGPTVKSYADALRSTGKYTEDQIATMSDEESAIAAFLQTRKAQLGSEEAAIEELKKNKNASIEIGRQLRDEADKRMLKDKLLKDAIKEVAVATESLLDIYRRLGANIQRFEAELGDVSNNIKGYLGDLSGSTEIQSVDRSGSERILGNISAYTAEEVRGAASSVSAMLGNTPESQQLADTASAAKILTDELPALLRANQGDRGAAVDQLEELFAAQGLDSGAIDAVLEEIRNKVSQDEGKDIGTLIQDIDQGIISKFSEQASEGAKKLQELAATYNNTIQEFINLQNQQNQAILKANEYYRQAAQIRLNAELDLAKALGRNLSLEELNKPFETEIGNLTQGLMNIGVLGADQAMDPAAIAAGIQEAANRNLAIEASQKELGAAFGEGTDAGQRQALNQAQLDNIQALGENKRAIEEGRAALEKLANDGSKAANALAKIQEEQKRLEAYGSSLDQALTASPEDLAKMNMNTEALNRVLAGDTRGLKTSQGRRAAYAGLEQDRGLIGEAEYNKRLAVLRRQSLMATQGRVTPEQEKMIQRLEKGLPDEEDPNVKAYREAVAVQEEAARKLGDLQMASADKIGVAMDDLRVFLQDKFPDLLAKAVADAQAASAGAAEAGKPKEPTSEAKAEQKRREESDKSAEMRQKEIEKAEREWKTKSDQAARLDREATASERHRADPVGRGLATTAAQQEAEAAARLNRLKAEDEAAKQAEQQQRASFDAARKQEEQKAKEIKSAEEARKASENRAKTEDVIDRAIRAQQGGQAIPTPLPAPPAPGTTQATYTGTRAISGSVVKPAQFAGVTSPVDTFVQARRQQEAALRQQTLEGLGLSKTSKEEELAKKERALRAATVAAAGAGTLETSPNVIAAQEAVDMAKQDLVSINEQITAEKQRLAALAEQIKLQQAAQPLVTSPTSIAPVPLTQPTAQNTTQQPGVSAVGGPSGGMGYTLTIDDKSIQFLNNLTDTFNKFGTYVDKLAGLDLTVEFAGNVTVDVNITGAAGLAALDKTMRDLATSLVEAKVSELRDELATVTRGAVRPSAARGSVSP